MNKLLMYLIIILLSFMCLFIVGFIGSGIALEAITMDVLSFKNVFLGIMKLSPLLVIIGIMSILVQKNKKHG